MRTGEAIGAGAKIYGYRVDNILDSALKMRFGMTNYIGEDFLEIVREDEEEDEEIDLQNSLNNSGQPKKKKTKTIKFDLGKSGLKTLEKEANISSATVDTQHQIDPLFRKKTQKFDDLSMSNLMTSTLNVNSNLLIQLDSQMAYEVKDKDKDTTRRQSGMS